MKNIKLLIVPALICVGIIYYALTLRGVPGNIQGSMIKNNLDHATMPLELSPERGRFILTKSLAEDHTFSLSKELANAADPDVGYYQGKFYIYFPPGISLLALPFYLIGRNFNLAQVGSFSIIPLFGILNMLLIYLISRNIVRLPAYLALFSAIVFGFGSTSWSYAITLYQHHVTTFLILSSFYCAWRYAHSSKMSWLFGSYIWVAYGFGVWVDYPNALFMLPIMAYFFFSSFTLEKVAQRLNVRINLIIIITSLLFAIIIGLHGYYNSVHFGDWKRVSGSLVGIKYLQRNNLLGKDNIEQKIANEANKKKNVGGFFTEVNTPFSFYTLFISEDRGLLLYSPIFVLAFLGIIRALKKRTTEIVVLLGTLFVCILLYSSWGDPWGGWAYGPRYLIPSMALLSIFIGVWISQFRYSRVARVIAYLLFAYSSAIALLGALTTNQVPPKIEGVFLHMKYNFLLNWDYFTSGRSGSFIFNEYFARFLSLQEYFLLIYISLSILVITVLFLVPVFSRKHES